MTLWERLLRALGYHKTDHRLSFDLDAGMVRALERLAEQEERSKAEVASELLAFALAQRDVAEAHLERWRALSPREQQVAALICLGYTNRQIAARLVIAPETAKTHVRHVLGKFGLSSKAALRQALSDWDFSAWQDADL